MLFDKLTFEDVQQIVETFYSGRSAEGCFAPYIADLSPTGRTRLAPDTVGHNSGFLGFSWPRFSHRSTEAERSCSVPSATHQMEEHFLQ